MIHVYYGCGKGKTTAAMGSVLRAVGAGWKVVVVQFLKGGSSAEIDLLQKMTDVQVLRGKSGTKFSFQMNEEERALTWEMHESNLAEGLRIVQRENAHMLVLDEALGALETGLLSEASLRTALEQLPDVEVILTGRTLPRFLEEKADYITEMVAQRHPFEKGVPARKGVEF